MQAEIVVGASSDEPGESEKIVTGPVKCATSFKVDKEIMRGVPLHWALRRPRIWIQPQLYRQTHRSAKLWSLSLQASSLDVFISHSWKTPGSQKILAFLLQVGWLHGLLGWCLATGLVFGLRLHGTLDQPLQRTLVVAGVQYVCGSTYWLLFAGAAGVLGGFVLSLYLPLKGRFCFLDIACVHQGDQEMLRRGISNISGCLAVSRELQVLYHPTYFTSRPTRFTHFSEPVCPFQACLLHAGPSCHACVTACQAFGACSSWRRSARRIPRGLSPCCRSSFFYWRQLSPCGYGSLSWGYCCFNTWPARRRVLDLGPHYG